MTWPGVGDLQVWRSGGRPGTVRIAPDITAPGESGIFEPALDGPVEVSAERWTRLIERDLFNLREGHPGATGERCCPSWPDG